MKPTIKIMFNRRKTATASTATKPKAGAVEIEISKDGKRKWMSTGVRIHTDQWNDGMVVNRIDSNELNLAIQKEYQKTYDMLSEGGLPAISMRKASFIHWMEDTINKRNISKGTAHIHLNVANNLSMNSRISAFEDVTVENIMRWNEDMVRNQGLKDSSITAYNGVVRCYVQIAKERGYLTENPYDKYKIKRTKREVVRYITEEERDRIEALELDGMIAKSRDMFVFACYTGLSVSDIRKVKDELVEEDGRLFIDGTRIKTKVHYRIMLLPKAEEILRRYNFNMNIVSTTTADAYLKVIQAMAGIKTKLSMHVGRHTFATWALNNGIPIEVVSKMLAHSDIKTTQIYAKVLQRNVTAGFEALEKLSGK